MSNQSIPQKVFDAEVNQICELAPGVRKITLKIQEPFVFQEAQYIWLELVCNPADPKGNRRAFSIFNQNNKDNMIEIVVRVSVSLYKKKLFSLKIGDKVLIHGPFGSTFKLDNIETQPCPTKIVFIAGGVGISVFWPTLRKISQDKIPILCHLVYLNKDRKSTPFLVELEEFKKQNSFFNYNIDFGYFNVDDLLKINFSLDVDVEWWISGPQGMVNHVFGELIKQKFSKRKMRFENYYPNDPNSLTFDKINQLLESTESNIFVQAIQNSTNHTVITDPDGKILFANKATLNITQFSADELIGQTPRIWGGMMDVDFYKSFWGKIKSGQRFQGEVLNRRKSGQYYNAIAHINPILNHNKDIVGYIGTEEDVSYIREQEKQATLYKNRLEMATQSANLGVWEWNLIKKEIVWNDNMYQIYGLMKDSFELTDNNWRNCIHVDDVEMRDKNINALIEKKESVPIDFRINLKNGKIRYIRSYALCEKNSNNQIEKLIGVNLDITREREVDKVKTEFVSLASHQLRTPLSIINWYTETLLSKKIGSINTNQEKYLSEIYKNSQKMTSLLNALLDISRLDLGTLVVETKQIDICILIQECLKDLQYIFLSKDIHLVEKYEIKKFICLLDENIFRIIVQNILSNAVKYSKNNSKILVKIKKNNPGEILGGRKINSKSISITVEDHGIGIAKKDEQKVFSKLFRAENAKKYSTEGTGLGLYLVKSVVEHSGGMVWFESTEGLGTIFYIVYPETGMRSIK